MTIVPNEWLKAYQDTLICKVFLYNNNNNNNILLFDNESLTPGSADSSAIQ